MEAVRGRLEKNINRPSADTGHRVNASTLGALPNESRRPRSQGYPIMHLLCVVDGQRGEVTDVATLKVVTRCWRIFEACAAFWKVLIIAHVILLGCGPECLSGSGLRLSTGSHFKDFYVCYPFFF